MAEAEDFFSPEYRPPRSTSAEEPAKGAEDPIDPLEMESMIAQEDIKRYGIGKPRREIIRARKL